MTPKRWQEIKAICHAALECPVDERAAFVASACGRDHELLHEVETLLAHANAASDFLRVPASAIVANLLRASASPIEVGEPSYPADDPARFVIGEVSTVPPSGFSSKADDLALPGSIGEFKILGRIGGGGTATVYLAYQESMRRNVALKVLHENAVFSESALARFEREAWIAGRLTHPNIVRVYDRGAAGTSRYIVMELVAGRSLAAFIEGARGRRKTSSVSESEWRRQHVRRVIQWFVGVTDALEYVHRQGIIHRDIKPLNLLLTKQDSHLLLTDFGLAQDARASGITQRGDFIGTIRYMSPEQLLAQRTIIDHRTDLWSLGVSLYEALTLALPFAGDSAEAYMSAVATKEPVLARRRDRAVPKDLETVLMKCLQRDPDRRYGSAGDLREDLTRFLEERPVLARRPRLVLKAARLIKRNRQSLAAISLVGTFMLLALSVLFFRWLRGRDIQRIQWTLQQVVDSGRAPETLQPDWQKLEGLLRAQIVKRPVGDLAVLARRAACGVAARIPAFGLLSEPPTLDVTYGFAVNPGIASTCVAEVQVAVDAGPWTPAASAIFRAGTRSGSWSRVARPGSLVMGPHRIDARVALSIFDDTDTRIVPPDVVMTAPLDQLWPAAAAARPYYREVRTLGTHSINLFETYPEDFPRQIAQSDAIASVSPWLRLNRVRMISVDPPFGPGCVRFALPGFPAEVYCPGQRAGTTHSVRVYELIGHMDKEMPIPLAAEAIVRLGDRADPVLKFTLCVGAGYFATDAALEAGSVGSLSAGRVSSIVWEDSPLGRPLVVNTPSGLATGWIDLVPSRAAALSTRQYDQYLGNTVSFPVEVESISVRGQWGQERNSR